MNTLTRQEYDALPTHDGVKICPANTNYSAARLFLSSHKFGENCIFGPGTVFAAWHGIGVRTEFGEGCRFDDKCGFFGSKTQASSYTFLGRHKFGDECELGANSTPSLFLRTHSKLCKFTVYGGSNLGKSSRIANLTEFQADCRIGDFSHIGSDCRLFRTAVGSNSTIGTRSVLTTGSRVGNDCKIGKEVTCANTSIGDDCVVDSRFTAFGKTLFGEGCLFGRSCTLINGHADRLDLTNCTTMVVPTHGSTVVKNIYAIVYPSKVFLVAGCFSGWLDDFEQHVKDKYKHDSYQAAVYSAAVDSIKRRQIILRTYEL